MHLERYELRELRRCLKQAEAALSLDPDRLIGVVAYLVAAGSALAEGRATIAAQILDRAHAGGPVPAWLDQQLNMVQSRACTAVGDIQAALAAVAPGSAITVETVPEAAGPWRPRCD